MFQMEDGVYFGSGSTEKCSFFVCRKSAFFIIFIYARVCATFPQLLLHMVTCLLPRFPRFPLAVYANLSGIQYQRLMNARHVFRDACLFNVRSCLCMWHRCGRYCQRSSVGLIVGLHQSIVNGCIYLCGLVCRTLNLSGTPLEFVHRFLLIITTRE